jgi:DNA-binding IclR family transcriptional regulator
MPRPPKRTAPRLSAPKTTTVVYETIDLATGRERHIRFKLQPGDRLTATCSATSRFYAALLPRTEYVERVGAAGPEMFRFVPGTDTKGFTDQVAVQEEEDYYLVLRNGVFNLRAHIATKVDLRRRGRVEPTIRSG